MSRIGKIARLDKTLRDELNTRLENGEPGKELVAWLNAEPDAQKALAKHFQGQAITEQNLSDWKQGGHQDWLRYQAANKAVVDFVDETEELVELVEEGEMIPRLAKVFAAELMQTALAWLAAETDLDKKWKRTCEVHRELSRLRRDEDRALHTRMKLEAWERDEEWAKLKHIDRVVERRMDKKEGREFAEALRQAREREACRNAEGAVVSQGVEHACTETAGKVGHRGTESTAVEGVDRAGASSPEQGRESGRIVANRVMRDGTQGTDGADGMVDDAGRDVRLDAGRTGETPVTTIATGEMDVAAIDTTGENGTENPQESGLIVADRVKKGLSDEG